MKRFVTLGLIVGSIVFIYFFVWGGGGSSAIEREPETPVNETARSIGNVVEEEYGQDLFIFLDAFIKREGTSILDIDSLTRKPIKWRMVGGQHDEAFSPRLTEMTLWFTFQVTRDVIQKPDGTYQIMLNNEFPRLGDAGGRTLQLVARHLLTHPRQFKFVAVSIGIQDGREIVSVLDFEEIIQQAQNDNSLEAWKALFAREQLEQQPNLIHPLGILRGNVEGADDKEETATDVETMPEEDGTGTEDSSEEQPSE